MPLWGCATAKGKANLRGVIVCQCKVVNDRQIDEAGPDSVAGDPADRAEVRA